MIIIIYMFFFDLFNIAFLNRPLVISSFFFFPPLCLAETKTHKLCGFLVNIVFSVLWDLFQILVPRVTAR